MSNAFWRIAIGNEVREFPEETCINDTWEFLREKLSEQDNEIAVVFEDQYGYRVGEIWDSSMFYAMAETVGKLASYLT